MQKIIMCAKNKVKNILKWQNFLSSFQPVCKNCYKFFTMCAKNVLKFLKIIQLIFYQVCKKIFVQKFANCKLLKMKKTDAKILYNKTHGNNQNIYRSKSCQAAVELCKFSMVCKAGLVSIAGDCLDGSLTGVIGSQKASSSSIVIGFSSDPSYSQGRTKSLTG